MFEGNLDLVGLRDRALTGQVDSKVVQFVRLNLVPKLLVDLAFEGQLRGREV